MASAASSEKAAKPRWRGTNGNWHHSIKVVDSCRVWPIRLHERLNF
jgi:hypothetical protein